MAQPFRRCVLPALLCLSAFGQAPLSIVYTGRTLGYFRYPEQQSRASFDRCVDNPSAMSEATRQFAGILKAQTADAQALVGMGDNFAMDLDARTFVDDGVRQPKDLWTWDYLSTPPKWILDKDVKGALAKSLAGGHGKIPADNVGCFLRWAGYDAIVPGNADFYYGPERLRMLARFLMTDQGAAFPKVAMLAANLAVTSVAPDANARIPDYQHERNILGKQSLPYQVVQKQEGEEPIIQVDIPDTVLPWLRKIAIHNAFEVLDANQKRVALQNQPDGTKFHERPRNPGPDAPVTLDYRGEQPSQTFQVRYRFDTVELCPAAEGDPRDPYRLDLSKCTGLKIDADAAKKAADDLNNDLYFMAPEQVLRPNANWGVCLRWKNPPAKNALPLCQLFSVHAPFLQYPEDAEVKAPPYLIKDSPEGKLAIFGVVDPGMVASIGRLNYAWMNQDPEFDTQIEVLDPAVALDQLMQECEAHEDCKGARKILLAHMPAAAASNLVTNIGFHFDLVISETDDAHETGDVQTSKRIVANPQRGTDERPPTLVTPGSVYNQRVPGKILLIAQKATLNRPAGCNSGACAGWWSLTNETASATYTYNRPVGPGLTLREGARMALRQAGVKSSASDPDPTESWTSLQILERLATMRMQQVLHTDLAMIQGRDVFEAKQNGDTPITPQNLKEVVDRVYWKDDYALALPLTGAALKAVLQKSAALAAEEKNSVNIDLERGRALAPLGVFQELATKAVLVNSQPIQDGALYSAGVTDYLAFGDTGYTEFLTPAVPPAFRLRDFGKLHPIANTVCLAIKNALTPSRPEFSKAECGPESLKAEEYEDGSDLKPFDTTAGYTAWRQFAAWAVPSPQYHRSFPLYAGASLAEKASQQKPRFSFSVEKTDLSIAINQHQKTLLPVTAAPGGSAGSIDLQASKFAGNPIPEVTAPDSSSFRYDNRTRFRWSGRRFDYFLMDDLAFASSKTQGTPVSPNYVRSLSTNALGLEAGTLIRLFPKLKQDADVKLLVSQRFDTQLNSPLLSLTLHDAAESNYLHNLNRTYRDVTKVGFRLENSNSWIEAGFQGGENFRLPVQYKFGNQVCQAGAGEDYHNAILGSAQSSVSPAYYPGDQSLLDCMAYYSYSAPAGSTASLGSPYLAPLSAATILPYSPLSIVKTNRPELGAFVNFSVNIPLPFTDKISYLLENKGDLFANGRNDLATDTHYFDELSSSLLIAARGNLAIKPEFDVFVYDGKVNGYKIHTYQALLNLSYAFDWHSGLPLWRTMLYANPPAKDNSPTGGK